jgi:uncharacterized membrane protein YphA (DoxX/SURF4 family)
MVISAKRGLALARSGFGLYYVSQAYDKTTTHWFSSGAPLTKFLQGSLPKAEGFYRSFIHSAVLPHAGTVAQLTTIGEWTAGILLVLGLFTRLGALVGIWLNLNYMLLKGLASTGGSVDRLFVLSCLVFLLASAGLAWGLDGVLRDAVGRVPVMNWLTGGGPEERVLPAPAH